MKRYTAEDKIKTCEHAIKAKKENNIAMHKTAKELGIPNTSLHTWLIEYEDGTLEHKKNTQDEFGLPESLMKAMDEELNKTEMINVLVFVDSPENSIMVSVKKPDTDSVDEYNKQMDRLVFEEIQWCFAMKGFKFNKGD
jgi:transposase-like protein